MYGRKYMGIERTTFLIGADGKIKKIFRKVKPEVMPKKYTPRWLNTASCGRGSKTISQGEQRERIAMILAQEIAVIAANPTVAASGAPMLPEGL